MLVAAQTPANLEPIDIADVMDSILICDNSLLHVDSTGKADPATIPASSWQRFDRDDCYNFIPNSWITKKIFLTFRLTNKSDSLISIYFIPGTYMRSMETYIADPGKQLVQLENLSRGDGFQPIQLKGGEEHVYIAEFNFTKRTRNFLIPQLIRNDYLVKYQKFQYYRHDTQLPVGYLLSGVLLMMVFFTGANYAHTGKKEFLYNCCYAICMFLLIFLNTWTEKKSGTFPNLFREYFDLMLLSLGTVFYIAFTRKFLETKTNHPILHKIFVNEEKFVLLFLGAYTYFIFATDAFSILDILENTMKLIVLIFGIVYIVIALAQKNRLMNYLAIGNAILILFSFVSLALILFPVKEAGFFLKESMIWYEIGVVAELVCFLLGLIYKNRKELIEKTQEQEALKLEAEKQSFETKLAVLNAQQEERNRISADMHDDLGAGVTAIRLYSELAKRRVGNMVVPEIEKISSSANELLNNMNAIIWTMSSSNDSLDNMVAYIRSYALEYFENTGINCHSHVDEDLPNIPVSGDIRRNVYLVVKEALNNILKHAKATEVYISLKRVPDGLSLYIQDNGTGVDFDKLRRFGNGLNNMKKRMEERHISFKIENHNGTLITLHYNMNLNFF